MCLNLNSCALDQQPWKDSKIHNFAIRANAEKCLDCKIVWDGLEAIGFGKESMIFSYSTYGTFRLTRQNILASYSLEPTLEYYLAPEESQGSGPKFPPSK
jgi:hypothetical protein